MERCERPAIKLAYYIAYPSFKHLLRAALRLKEYSLNCRLCKEWVGEGVFIQRVLLLTATVGYFTSDPSVSHVTFYYTLFPNSQVTMGTFNITAVVNITVYDRLLLHNIAQSNVMG